MPDNITNVSFARWIFAMLLKLSHGRVNRDRTVGVSNEGI